MRGSANLFGFSGCGGSSLTTDHAYVPVSRPLDYPAPIDDRLEYAVLDESWADGAGLCADEDFEPNDLPCEVLLAEGDVASLSSPASDYYQNLLRRHDDTDGALAAARTWTETWPSSPTAHERLGELLFLQEDWDGSAAESSEAARLYVDTSDPDGAFDVSTGGGWALLRAATAEHEAGRYDEAAAVLATLSASSDVQDTDDVDWDPALPMYVQQELGLVDYDRGDFETAITELQASIDVGTAAEAGPERAVPRAASRRRPRARPRWS